MQGNLDHAALTAIAKKHNKTPAKTGASVRTRTALISKSA